MLTKIDDLRDAIALVELTVSDLREGHLLRGFRNKADGVQLLPFLPPLLMRHCAGRLLCAPFLLLHDSVTPFG